MSGPSVPLTPDQVRAIVRDELRLAFEELAEEASGARRRDCWVTSTNTLRPEQLDEEAVARFWSKVDRAGPVPESRPDLGPCWLWLASRKDGYGRVKIRGITYQAHRVAYVIGKGDLDTQRTIDHLCRVKHCQNPDHLDQVPMLTNLRRADNAPTSVNRMKTACEHGHPFDDDTIHLVHNGRSIRKCRRCRQSVCARRLAAQRAAPRMPRPPRDVLEREIRTQPMTAIGIRYGVSDNAVRKWARRYGLDVPRRAVLPRPRGLDPDGPGAQGAHQGCAARVRRGARVRCYDRRSWRIVARKGGNRMARRKKGARVLGPFPDRIRGCWRIKYVDIDGGTSHERCETEQQAHALATLLRARAEAENLERRPEITVSEAIGKYELYLRDGKGNKPKSVSETVRRLRAFLRVREADAPGVMLRSLTPDGARALYEAECTRLIGSGDKARPVAADFHRNVLAETKTFGRWCVERGWIKASPFEGIKGRGRRRKGKAQLRIDEARKWTEKAIELANAGRAGAVAAMMTLLMDLRCSEITSRVVRDIDDGGKLIWIPEAKTEAGKRTIEVPLVLQPYLRSLAQGRPADALVFGRHWRDWPRHWVQRICKQAGIPMVTAHGMRGTHASLAVERGMSSHLVAAAMGHESDRTTLGGSYATLGAQTAAKQKRALSVLRVG